ncbi:MAG: helix-turn-helix domain-containing protein [Bacteroidia bacterium]
MQTNPQLQLAFEFVQYTSKNVFLTGKAGTGKTTFLHNLRKSSPKRMAVVAPTGVAAINAGGVTIHSFFQLPFGPYIPGESNNQHSAGFNKKFSKEKIKLIRSLDLLVIDEVSMVRSDILDGIDDVLKRYRNRMLPFGGLQLLMIGDLHQLAPIIKEDEWNILKNHYDTGYFFGSKALQQSKPVIIELKEIFRQSDEYFISLLNKVRENNLDHHSMVELNERYLPGFIPAEEESYITLTTHNATAQQINQSKLDKLKSKLHVFTASIKGDFPEFSYPTEFELQLKEHAQVMFVKNDISKEKLFYNGKIGKITRMKGDVIYVKCPGNEPEIAVNKMEWKNVRYSLDENKKVIEDEIGSFIQYPLKLAWAITIHKSQGLTFDKAIIDANASFAHGQVYVALSRCRNFEGMVLRSQISASSIKTDHAIADYTREIKSNQPGAEYLLEEKRNFQSSLLQELFDFSIIRKLFYRCKKEMEENKASIEIKILDDLQKQIVLFEREMFDVNEKFKRELHHLIQDENLPEENPALQKRVQKASHYFGEKSESLFEAVKRILVESDNKAVLKIINEAMENLKFSIFRKKNCFTTSQTGFLSIAYLQAKANSEIDFDREIKQASKNKNERTVPVSGNALYDLLRAWRDEKSEELGADTYMILQRKVLKELSELMPSNDAELARVKGIGKAKIEQFGNEILDIINSYCEKNNISRQPVKASKMKAEKKESAADTKLTSFQLFNNGWTVSQIAKERGLTTGTIEGHLAYFVSKGKLDIFRLISKEKFQIISDYLEKNPSASFSEAKIKLGAQISYADIRLVAKNRESQLTEK